MPLVMPYFSSLEFIGWRLLVPLVMPYCSKVSCAWSGDCLVPHLMQSYFTVSCASLYFGCHVASMSRLESALCLLLSESGISG